MGDIADTILRDPERPLRRMDIFLTRDRQSWVQSIISWCTQCWWAHPAVTFVIPSEPEFRHAFVMESAGEGVDVHNADKYFGSADRYDFAIVRPRAEWFSGTGLDHENLRRKARGRMLEAVDAAYDTSTVLKLFFDLLFRRPHLRTRAKAKRKKRDAPPTAREMRKMPQEFMCSAFASHSLYQIANELDAQDNGVRVDDVLFNPMFDDLDWDKMSPDDRQRIVLSTTPADMAFSDLLEWKWVVIGGKLHKVDRREEADRILIETYGSKIPAGHREVQPT